MKLKKDKIQPYFQTTIYQVNSEFKIKDLIKKIEEQFQSTKLEKHKVTKRETITKDNPFGFHLLHEFTPSWYDSPDQSESSHLKNIENVLLILFHERDYLFIHCQCDVVLTLISVAMSELQKQSTKLKISKVKRSKIQNVWNSKNGLESKTLGIDNIYNAGGSAPEAKAYFAKNSLECLTVASDSGYGFNYGLGTVTQNNTTTKTPFGCSSKKAKIWGSWQKDFDDFKIKCLEIADNLDSTASLSANTGILLTPIEVDANTILEPFGFYLTYYLHSKGMIDLRYNGESLTDYYFEFEDSKTLKLISKNSIVTTLTCLFSDSKFQFSYLAGANGVEMQFLNSEKESKSVPLNDYLNKGENFTILFEGGLSYKDGSFFKDNRLFQLFNRVFLNNQEKLIKSLDWQTVNIKKEDDGTDNILNSLVNALTLSTETILVINDNGANEVADLLVLTNDNRFILIHAKYSKEFSAGLRTDDVQIVCSQALKNVRYFSANAYQKDKFEERLTKNSRLVKNSIGSNSVVEFLCKSLNNPNIDKECWIVQPGISKKKLEKDGKNKIHALFNFVDGIMKAHNIKFKVFGSERKETQAEKKQKTVVIMRKKDV